MVKGNLGRGRARYVPWSAASHGATCCATCGLLLYVLLSVVTGNGLPSLGYSAPAKE